jgi:hypothetical protein
VNAEIVTKKTKLAEIIVTTQAANSNAEKEVALKAKQICIICMHYLSIVEANVDFKQSQMSSTLRKNFQNS